MKIYQIGTIGRWTGATMEIQDEEGAPIGWTRSVPPALAEGEIALWVGGWQTAKEPPLVTVSEQSEVPASVPMRNARLALSATGLLSTVQNYITNMTGQEGEEARIDWQFALNVRRDSPLVKEMTQALGKSEGEIDALFIKALDY